MDPVRLSTAAQMRAAECATMAEWGVTGETLMERAGAGAVAAILEHWPELAAPSATGPEPRWRALVLAGPGNNGGDGFVVARLLAERGWLVEVFLYGAAEKLSGDARSNYERWLAFGEVLTLDEASVAKRFMPNGPAFRSDKRLDVVVDALFGTGLSRPLDDALATALATLDTAVPEGTVARVALDVPSGLCADSGRVLVADDGRGRADEDPRIRDVDEIDRGLASHQDLTVTFETPKLGHYLADGPEWCGAVRVVDLAIPPPALVDATRPSEVRLAQVDRLMLRKGSEEYPAGHKYEHGHAVILSGGVGRGGAARMAARGALRVGAGLVTLACPPAALQENAAQLNAVMLRPVADAGALADLLAADPRLNAVGLGPGLGGGEATRSAVNAVLAAERATVVDADALTAFADAPRALFEALHPRAVLTPHAGEFRRLFPDIAERLSAFPTSGPAYSKIDAARAAAVRAGCVVLFKGPDTVIAAPEGEAAISAARYERAAPWLATAGAGDVLTGMIAGLLARGFRPLHAAETAAHLHVDAALAIGPGLIAEDIPEALPGVFRALGL